MIKTALIIVDMLYDFAHPEGKVYYPMNKKILPSILKLLKAARKQDCLIVFMQQRYRKDKIDNNLQKMRVCCIEGSGGEDIIEALEVDKIKDYIIPKRRFSSFYGTDLDLVLRENHIQHVVIVGTKTNNCINATVLDAHYLNYKITVIKECVGTSDEVTNDIYLRDIDSYLGQVISLDEALALLKSGEWS